MKNICALLLLLLLPLVAAAQIYKTTDENGNVTYTDQPPSGTAEKVVLPTLNTSAPPPEISRPEAEQDTTDAGESVEYAVSITAPAHEETIPLGYAGNFNVSATAEPADANQTYTLYLDGAQVGTAQAEPVWALSNIFRGAHELHVTMAGEDGKTVATSETITVFVQRPISRN